MSHEILQITNALRKNAHYQIEQTIQARNMSLLKQLNKHPMVPYLRSKRVKSANFTTSFSLLTCSKIFCVIINSVIYNVAFTLFIGEMDSLGSQIRLPSSKVLFHFCGLELKILITSGILAVQTSFKGN